jgi:hypothetical protein
MEQLERIWGRIEKTEQRQTRALESRLGLQEHINALAARVNELEHTNKREGAEKPPGGRPEFRVAGGILEPHPAIAQMHRLADYIIGEIPEEPGDWVTYEEIVNATIRLLKQYREALQFVVQELSWSLPKHPCAITNAHDVAKDALGIQEKDND